MKSGSPRRRDCPGTNRRHRKASRQERLGFQRRRSCFKLDALLATETDRAAGLASFNALGLWQRMRSLFRSGKTFSAIAFTRIAGSMEGKLPATCRRSRSPVRPAVKCRPAGVPFAGGFEPLLWTSAIAAMRISTGAARRSRSVRIIINCSRAFAAERVWLSPISLSRVLIRQ